MINQENINVLRNLGFEFIKDDPEQMVLNVMLTARIVSLEKMLHLSKEQLINMAMATLQNSLNKHFERMNKIENKQSDNVWQMS